MAKMNLQRARQQQLWAAGWLRAQQLPIDANQLEESLQVLLQAEREAGRREPVRKSYESTVMRMAGNIAGGLLADPNTNGYAFEIAKRSVEVARAIVAEVLRTGSSEPSTTT